MGDLGRIPIIVLPFHFLIIVSNNENVNRKEMWPPQPAQSIFCLDGDEKQKFPSGRVDGPSPA